MNGQHIAFYRFPRPPNPWACYLRRRYTFPQNASTTLAEAELMMRGDHSDCLWRKADESARRLIWC